MSTVGGSIIALWSANGIDSKIFFVLSLSNDAHPPFSALHRKYPFHGRALRNVVLVALSRGLSTDFEREQNLTGVIYVRLMVVIEEEAPAACDLRSLTLCDQSPLHRISLESSQSAALHQPGDHLCAADRHSPSVDSTCAVSHTGEKHGCIRKVGVG